MSLLLKNLWRNVLRNNQISQPMITARTLSSVTELTSTKHTDNMMMTLRSAQSSAAILAAVQQHLPHMTHTHLLQALRALSQIQTLGSSDETEKLVKDPSFVTLCQTFNKHARALDINEAIEATKALSYLKVPIDSLILQTMLQIIRANINELNIRQVMFLDFLLNKFEEKNSLLDALKLALPLVFQIHLPLEMDNDDLPLLRSMMAYACTHDVPDRCINNIVTGLLLHDQHINGHVAKSIVWSLTQVNCTPELFPTRVQLLHICIDIVCQYIDDLTFEDVLRTSAKLKGRIVEKHAEFYNEQYFDAAAGYAVRRGLDFEKSLLLARILSRIAHTNLSLVEYLCRQISTNPQTLSNARTNILFSFVNCLANSNYTPEPETWTEIRRQISSNNILNVQTTTLPWVKFSLELASLGHYEGKLLTRIFSKEFLDEFLAREDSHLDYLQLHTLYEAVKVFYSDQLELPKEVVEKAKSLYRVHALATDVESCLARGLGAPEYVTKNVVLTCGFVVDNLLCLKNGYPIKLPSLKNEENLVPIEDLKLPAEGLTVCIMHFSPGSFSMNSNRLRGTFRLVLDILEKQGYATVPINVKEWLNVPGHERTPYLLREIGYKCGEVGMKLCVS